MPEPTVFFQDEYTTIIHGDVVEALAKHMIPMGQVQLVMTSPPYWRQRNYTQEGWGSEVEWNDWVDKLTNLGRWLKLALCDSGSVFLNIGDKYGGGSGYNLGAKGAGVDRRSVRKAREDVVNRNGNLMLLPFRVAQEFTDVLGFTCLDTIVWHKPDPSPQSWNDKWVTTWEPIFYMVKNPEKHKFYRERIGVEKRDRRVTPKAMVKAEQERVLGKQKSMFGVTEIAMDPAKPPKPDSPEYEYWYNNVRIKQGFHDGADDINSQGQRYTIGKALQHPSGSNPGDVWSVMTANDPFFKNEEETRPARSWPSWPVELLYQPILATTDPGDIVMDTFGGSGSLGVAAKELGRKSILVDVDRDSCEIMARRILATSPQV